MLECTHIRRTSGIGKTHIRTLADNRGSGLQMEVMGAGIHIQRTDLQVVRADCA